MTNKEIYQEFWAEINRLQRPESNWDELHIGDTFNLSDGTLVEYELIWMEQEETVTTPVGSFTSEWYEPVVSMARIIDEDGNILQNITSIVK